MLIASFRKDLINAELDIFISHLKKCTVGIEGQNTAGGKANMEFFLLFVLFLAIIATLLNCSGLFAIILNRNTGIKPTQLEKILYSIYPYEKAKRFLVRIN